MRVFRLDREHILAELRERADSLIRARPDVIEVRLFGSLARGTAKPGSDADLLILLSDGAGRFLDRSAELGLHFEGCGLGCDILAYTESEWQRLCRARRRVTMVAIREGIVLARREERPATR